MALKNQRFFRSPGFGEIKSPSVRSVASESLSGAFFYHSMTTWKGMDLAEKSFQGRGKTRL
jgi:hypothetical protein